MLTILLWSFLVACGPVVCVGDPEAGDADADGLCDDVDPCPADALDDSDGDGSCDADDACVGDDRLGDADGDGTCDDLDPCPLDAPPHDDDGDGACDAWDFCAGHDASGDADGDGTCDDLDPCFGTGVDTDGDGTCDDLDPCPADALDDADHDGSCDADDLCTGDDRAGDADGDGTCDDLDPCPLDAPPHDDDGDGNCDTWDFCAGHDASGDADHDGTCDDLDPCFGTGADTDGDGTCDDADRCPLDALDDSDLDGSCDADDLCDGDDRDGDDDADGVCDGLDACWGDDLAGDADDDDLCDDLDPCLGASDVDTDGDGLCDEGDLCPETFALPRPCEPAPTGLAHLWTGDGHARDVVGGAEATLVDAATVDQPGAVHRGFQLQVPTTSRITLPPEALDEATDLTLAFWVRSTDVGYGLFSAAGAGSSNAFLVFVQDVTVEVHVFGTASVVRSVPAFFGDLAWHHFAVTRDVTGTESEMRAYLDGVLVDTWVGPDGAIDVQSIVLGQDQDSIGGGFQANQAMQGRLDEIALYRRALDADEVARLAAPEGICEGEEAARAGGDDPLCPITWHVDPAAPASGDGRSFATAFRTLAEAEVAAPGDAVWVKAGPLTVDETVNPPSDTTWLGGFAGTETDPGQRCCATAIDAQGVVFSLGSTTSWVTLDGFDVAAAAPGYRAVDGSGTLRLERGRFSGFAPATGDGGAVTGVTVVLDDVLFDGNASTGAGGAVTAVSRLVARDARFQSNVAANGGAVALSSISSRGVFLDASFDENDAAGDGGAIHQVATSQVLVEGGWFGQNTAGDEGGAIYAGTSATTFVEGATFWQNTAPTDGSAIRSLGTLDVVDAEFHENGGKVVRSGNDLDVVNAAFVDNGSGYLLSTPGDCTTWGSTFTGNATTGSYFACGEEVLREAVFIGNTPAEHGGTCLSCCAPGGTVDSGASTLVRDPRPDRDWLDRVLLPADSPCRDAGTTATSNAAPFLDDFWWRALTTTLDDSLDGDPPDMGRHYAPAP